MPEDIIHDPYVLELLGLNLNDDFYEGDLEEAFNLLKEIPFKIR